MNNSSHETNRDQSGLRDQAELLASLTKNLAHCCVSKEVEIFHRYGLSASEGHLLLAVSEAGEIAPSVVAERLGVGRSRLTPLAQGLVEKGFLTRRESTMDRRMRDLTLTAHGQTAAKAAAEFRLNFHARLLESFPDPVRQRLIETLNVLHDRMLELRCELLDVKPNGNGKAAKPVEAATL
ncbi:MAG: MarR family winged helix-turn-helix transcriptional regulator [Calditrichota bacterium]